MDNPVDDEVLERWAMRRLEERAAMGEDCDERERKGKGKGKRRRIEAADGGGGDEARDAVLVERLRAKAELRRRRMVEEGLAPLGDSEADDAFWDGMVGGAEFEEVGSRSRRSGRR